MNLSGWLYTELDGDLTRLNSMTKYPSILTYHALGEKGALIEDQPTKLVGKVFGTEKVDGTNGRIILTSHGYFIGSREELLYAKGDIIGNPALGIVDALKPVAEKMSNTLIPGSGDILVAYLEVFGGRTHTNSKQYTGSNTVGTRLFDVAIIHHRALDGIKIDKIAAMRESPDSFQHFRTENELTVFSNTLGLKRVPNIFEGAGEEVPTSISGVLDFLKAKIPNTLCSLDEGAGGKPEGMVIRSSDRQTIVKLRYEDYERTMKRMGGKK